jgi:hypothetical protein
MSKEFEDFAKLAKITLKEVRGVVSPIGLFTGLVSTLEGEFEFKSVPIEQIFIGSDKDLEIELHF